MPFTESDLGEVLDVIAAAGLDVIVTGGWGVDALLGIQTRPHADLDLVARLEDDDRLRSALAGLGFVEVDGDPTNFVMRDAAGREVDLHLAMFEGDGRVVYAGGEGDPWIYPAVSITTGRIGARFVVCLTAEQQVLDHAFGYEPAPTDHADMAALRERFGVDLPAPYGDPR